CPDGKIDPDELPAALPGDTAAILLTAPAVFQPEQQCGLEVDRANLAQRYGLPVLAVCQCGATDGMVYSGQSTAHDAGGALLARARAFEPDALAVRLDAAAHALTCTRTPEPKPGRAESMFRAAVLAVRDYARKCGVKGVLLGLSGGMDSALVACIAAEALGTENVFGVLMPSRFSSGHSLEDAQKLADNLGMRAATVGITPMMDAFSAALAPSFSSLPAREGDLTADNLQPRIRGTLLMAFANRLGYAVLGTGNKSENAMGYCTLYGDTVGALEPIGDVYKTEVYDIASWYNEHRGSEIIPRNVFDKPPSAELHPDQVDEDNLPPYPVLDAILRELLENAANPETLTVPGVPENVVRDVARRLAAAEFKRHQSPPAVKMSCCTLGIDWHMPASARYV
ncbi:MAG: NAD(+) synthase, partial [Mailhella sp.]|nr:NAD(+) synthase [Mailhella sp.]